MLFLLLACGDPLATDTGAGELDVERAPLQFRFPLTDPDVVSQYVGVDHDPDVHEGAETLFCTGYDGRGFPWCYDEHKGSDYLLEGGFDAMDAGSTPIVAAADGVVVATEDGHYDRCHGDLSTVGVSCDGNDGIANSVIVAHEGAYTTHYWHMMKDSVAVAVGDQVSAGDLLGIVGSSGNSSGPHLHFQLEDADGEHIDPYAGSFSQEETWWCEQGLPEGLPGLCD